MDEFNTVVTAPFWMKRNRISTAPRCLVRLEGLFAFRI